ncbi:MAG: thiamine phosphate synthase [Gemmatimonadetes bacterium]|nr:thiamine phosphate synthase [Gemmatimonadota bacterium]
MTGFDVRALRLIAITDDLRDGPTGLLARSADAIRGGATMVQLRLKAVEPRALVEVAKLLVSALSVPIIVNDRLDVALAAGAHGVHLGADDLPPEAARRIAPAGFIIGASVGEEREVADAKAADYVGIGPVFGTASKADAGPAIGVARFQHLARLSGRPAVAIGGIEPANAGQLATAGAAGIAVIRAVLGARHPESAARALRQALGDAP